MKKDDFLNILLPIYPACLIQDMSYRFISAEEAWADFKAEYLGDYANDFDENPLADSFNYEVSIWLGANTQQVREQISQLDGVRRVTTIREANELQKSVE